ncbi:MAG: hypothetical protein FD161_366 [Limisphaerales bacterium]|nr:MAG: hypothetical protein FD161_366 [Limisphaerales bacterium]KAG0510812.1 MAG: hypothetical protein E1N63_366 [Limisphaerales bacterium]TXT52708.1 MAG: hypothetical protein FD140_628 [Limisphaerales bacterium]
MSLPPASREPQPAHPPDGPVHPLAAGLLVFVDNLWMLADWNAVTWFLTIPLSFCSVAFTTVFIQRFLHRDGWGKSLGKGLLLGVLAGVPTSITGTPVGLALLTWAGIMRAKGAAAPTARMHETRASAHAPPPPIPIEAQVISSTPSGPPPPPVATAPPPPPAAPVPPRRVEPWWVKLAMVLLLCATALLVTKMILDRTDGLAAKFRQQTITETFLSALPTLARTPGGALELATATATETLARADEKTIAWDMIYLGKTVSEISVPVTYRYHLVLRDPWKLEVSGNTCIVHAPAIRPSLPPAIHTDQMRKHSEAGWARFDAREQMAELERSLTPRLTRNAGDPRRLALVREECRKTVAEFVRDWLLRENHWRKDRFTAIQVVFVDEPQEKSPPPVTLRLP